ncbi:hypothetical protein M9H77_06128 [Catharanthus roseus]|uniref:Uncharacterized protein n=1 Tax=Catharanthus roseus TaxID=4058 RepID=A0ACC0BRL3_CATRO|nr:hypothetical protein M9H77_06128 [Catharanthus roseus]
MAIKEYWGNPSFSEHDRDDLCSLWDEEDGGKAANLLAVNENRHGHNVNPSEGDFFIENGFSNGFKVDDGNKLNILFAAEDDIFTAVRDNRLEKFNEDP